MMCDKRWINERACAVASLPILLAAGDAYAQSADLEEIVVTASRREQSVQDVAASVAVIDPESYATAGLNSLDEVLKYVPGVNFNDGGAPGQGSITMRGVANIFSTASVGIYVDDVPYGSVTAFAEGANFALDNLLGNVERVEIIKGPQGTLFGASSMGGSVRYITRDPSLTEIDGAFTADFSDTQEGDFNQLYKGEFSMPIVEERLALGVSGFWQETGGFIDETSRSLENVNNADLVGGRAALLFDATDELSFELSYTDQKFEFSNSNSVPFDVATGEPLFGRYAISSPIDTPTEINFELIAGSAEYRTDWATATLVSSSQEFAQNAVLDLTTAFGAFVDGLLGVPPGTNTVLLDLDISTERTVHEFRLTSPDSDQVEWLAGLYYTKEESNNFQGAQVIPGPLDLVTQQFPSDYEEIAAFGNLTWYFSPELDATVGLRLSSNEMAVQFTGTGVLAGPNLPPETVEDDVQTYLFNLRYRPNEDTSIYGRIANGYRPASANLSLIDPATGEVLSVPFIQSDSLWSYEVGAKGSLLDGVLLYDVAIYTLMWEDLQVFRSFMGVNVGGNAVSDVTANGFESTVTWQPTDAFDLAATVAYTRSELDDDDPSVGGLAGEQLPRIPEFTWSLNGTYTFPLGDMDAFVGAGIAYQDERKTQFIGGAAADGTVIAPANPNFTVPDYTLVDLSAGVAFDRYRVSLYANNLLGEYGFQNAGTSIAGGTATVLQPRTVGLVLNVEF
ncbi:MAG TPA: TonB-dependent receptor [Woeseiaceae bacterium]|nr:TonB-dependent receptor [Woeseiaceae bacterium]